MYVGLLLVYTGIAMIHGNWWTFLLIPLVIFIITRFVIINEEKYLERAFGQDYMNYKKKVRRWL
jgi:protein-S-isoprenylcysteine O-methyltransferase Ste14